MNTLDKTTNTNRHVTREFAHRWLTDLMHIKSELDQQWSALRTLTGADSDSPFGNIVWSSFELLITSVGELVGDDGEILSWYIWDNECGAKKFEHSLPSGQMQLITSINDLLDVLGY